MPQTEGGHPGRRRPTRRPRLRCHTQKARPREVGPGLGFGVVGRVSLRNQLPHDESICLYALRRWNPRDTASAPGFPGCKSRGDKKTPTAPLGPECREPMKLVKTIPHLGGLPEIFLFYCSRCRQADTKEQAVCRRPTGVVVGNERKTPTFWEV
jgi:hypothetical protein